MIDISKSNGLGDVIEKNILLLPQCSEKLTAVFHKNGTDVWVIAHGWNTNNFYAYHISKKGMEIPVVISSIGNIHEGGKTPAGNSIGQMKFSADGKHLAVVMFDSKYFELYNFDNNSGLLSEDKMIYLPEDESAYGCEFSPDGRYLYLGLYWKNQIYQYDINLPSGAQIMNSSILIATSNDSKLGSMQLVADGKIYVTKKSAYLGVINNPNEEGKQCDYDDNGLFIKYGKLQLGLPSFIQSYFYKP
jgi:WD40 repeat protein